MSLTKSILLLAVASLTPFASAATVNLNTSNDFFTTRWAFTAPYVRGVTESPAISSLGVSTPNPFLQGTTSANAWEETTYFQFDFASAGLTSPVEHATLRAGMVARPWGLPVTESAPFNVSAHRVTGDPTTLIDPQLGSGDGSYIQFKNDRIAAVEDTIAVTGVGVFEWDITDLVNEWIANGETNFDYTLAMTGRVGNPADDAESGIFHAFVNSGSGAGQIAQVVITVPEPTSLAAMSGIALGMARRGKRGAR